jgi:hypothetical protein
MNNLKFIEPEIYFWIYEEKLVVKTLAFPYLLRLVLLTAEPLHFGYQLTIKHLMCFSAVLTPKIQ